MATAIKKPAPAAVAPVAQSPEPKIEKTVEAFSAPIAEIQDNVRKALEKGVADTRAAYAKAKAAAEETSVALESSRATAAKGVVEFNTKALEALRTNAEANFDFLKALISVKSVSEFVALQGEHARKQAETITAQAKEIAALSQKVADESAAPIKSQIAKTFKLAV
ncbi:phasin [Methylocapsa sp. S129]|uniref:phasin n=1 Tax=Methylocapsa sp. S129 TaxID=1641869 RepID=UPI00131C3D6B|nr:phasin [Methylocapsa sp. S129]